MFLINLIGLILTRIDNLEDLINHLEDRCKENFGKDNLNSDIEEVDKEIISNNDDYFQIIEDPLIKGDGLITPPRSKSSRRISSTQTVVFHNVVNAPIVRRSSRSIKPVQYKDPDTTEDESME
ncbi:uncharacterized protein I206_100068 [Kwoniella pini CBS 10737]|uniref:Uncharacterized protein n=1 Tax=Kwoniella pini CBS 10737 TaxID=1296096 RepID=A0A1B9HSF8_9TREE|nr:uncharacterized protein I206_07883 [Kwoniella pini CBS 10737]OCF46212.1 hypothetical protein I206_07883 [Kwoniella pini CBS 10737]